MYEHVKDSLVKQQMAKRRPNRQHGQEAAEGAEEAEGGEGGDGEGGEGDGELFCMCRQPYDAKRFMIGCDRCPAWVHPRCVGVSVALAQKLSIFVCPNCRKTNAVSKEQHAVEGSSNTVTARWDESHALLSCLQQVDSESTQDGRGRDARKNENIKEHEPFVLV